MAKETLKERLGLVKQAPIPPKYQPKLLVTLTCTRNKKTCAFEIPLPIEGFAPHLFVPAIKKLRASLIMLGILPALIRKTASEKNNGSEETAESEKESTPGTPAT